MSETVVVFGSRLIADNWARAHGVDCKKVVLGTEPHRLRGAIGDVKVVRVSKDIWAPVTSACEWRMKETEVEIKRMLRGR